VIFACANGKYITRSGLHLGAGTVSIIISAVPALAAEN